MSVHSSWSGLLGSSGGGGGFGRTVLRKGAQTYLLMIVYRVGNVCGDGMVRNGEGSLQQGSLHWRNLHNLLRFPYRSGSMEILVLALSYFRNSFTNFVCNKNRKEITQSLLCSLFTTPCIDSECCKNHLRGNSALGAIGPATLSSPMAHF